MAHLGLIKALASAYKDSLVWSLELEWHCSGGGGEKDCAMLPALAFLLSVSDVKDDTNSSMMWLCSCSTGKSSSAAL